MKRERLVKQAEVLASDEVRHHLLEQRERIVAAISAYPVPITACDAQFNHLLEQRTLISAELARLDEAQRRGEPPPDPLTTTFRQKAP